MNNIIWLLTMIPNSILFTGIGIYAWKRKEPMWFWMGKSVSKEEITDVKAYNRANGIMWLLFSLIFWIFTIIGIFDINWAAEIIARVMFVSIPLLIISYICIYKKYKA